MADIVESDWKLLRTVKEAALDRICSRALDKCKAVIDGPGTSHERYKRLFTVLEKQDREIEIAFDGLRRSVALERLAIMIHLGLVTNEELARFTPRTQESVHLFLQIMR